MARTIRFASVYEPHAGDWIFMEPDFPDHGPSIYQIIDDPPNRQAQLKARRYLRPEEVGAWAANASPAIAPGEVVQGPVIKLWQFEAQGRCFVCHTDAYDLWIKDGTTPTSVLWDSTRPVFHCRRRLVAASETFQKLSAPVWLTSTIAHGTAPARAEGARGKRASECADREQLDKRVKLDSDVIKVLAQPEEAVAQESRDEARDLAREAEIAKLKAEVEHAEIKEALIWIALTLEYRPSQWLAAGDVEVAYERYRTSPGSRIAEVDWSSFLRLVSKCPTSLLHAAPGATTFYHVGFRTAPIDPVLVRWTLQNYFLDHRFCVTIASVFDAFRTSPCYAGSPLDPKFVKDIISLSRPTNGYQYLHSTAGQLLEGVIVLGLRPLVDPPVSAQLPQPHPIPTPAGPPPHHFHGDWSQLTPEQFAAHPPIKRAAIRESIARQHAWMTEATPSAPTPPLGPSRTELAFGHALATFFRQNRLKVPPHPVIEDRRLDMFLLHTSVLQARGFLKVQLDVVFWSSVLTRMGFTPLPDAVHPTARVAAIRASYAVALYPFERARADDAQRRREKDVDATLMMLRKAGDAEVRRCIGTPESTGKVARRAASVDSGYAGTSPAALAKHEAVPAGRATPTSAPSASSTSAIPTPTAARLTLAPAPAKAHPPTVPAAVARPTPTARALSTAPTASIATNSSRKRIAQPAFDLNAPHPRPPLASVALPSVDSRPKAPPYHPGAPAQPETPSSASSAPRMQTTTQKTLAALALPAFIAHMKQVDPNRSVHYDRSLKVLDGALVCPSMIVNVGKERLERLGLKAGIVGRLLGELGA